MNVPRRLTMLAAACLIAPALAQADPTRVVFVTHGQAADQYWSVVKRGVDTDFVIRTLTGSTVTLFNEATKLAGAAGTKGEFDAGKADELLGKIDEIARVFAETKAA